MNKFLTLSLLLSLAVFTYSKTCGEGPAIAAFEADVVSKINTDAPGFSSKKTEYDAWKATSAKDYVAGTFGADLQTFFTGKKTCCTAANLATLKGIYKIFIGGLLNSVAPSG